MADEEVHPTIGRSSTEEQDAWEQALLDALANSDNKEETAKGFNATLAQAQEICSYRGGHEWTHWEGGDGIYFSQSNDFCFVCGIDRGYDEEY